MTKISSKNSLAYCIAYYYTFINPIGSKNQCLEFCKQYKTIKDNKAFGRDWKKAINEL